MRGSICYPCTDSAETPYFNANAGKCQSCADAFGGKKDFWNPNIGECVAECPVATPKK